MEPIAHFTVWGQIKIDILMLPQTVKWELDWKLFHRLGSNKKWLFNATPNGEMILSPLLISPFGVALKCHFLFDPKRWNDLQFKIISPIGVALKSPFLFDP